MQPKFQPTLDCSGLSFPTYKMGGGGINLLWLIELWLKGTFNGYEGAFHPNGSERNSIDDCLESGC